ncbi:MAG: hypothetical protein EOO40_06815 [Deltaproteobacteria bacterium]|nr:MAG: hypothetical protein EOO40_06815 [Deltaproteobacteria bacterium]
MLHAFILTTHLLMAVGASPGITASETPVTARAAQARRPLFVGAELGLNGLTGFGAIVSYQFAEHFALDAALGFSSQMGRGGIRGRYTLRTGPVSPFVGVGVMYASGTPLDVRGCSAGKPITYRIDGGAFVQAVGGVKWMHRSGFTLLGSLGWTELVSTRSNIRAKTGTMTAQTRKRLDAAAGSGPVAAISVGYSF